MKTILSFALVLLAGLAGLAFVFTDVLIAPPGLARIAVGGLFYAVVGFVIQRVQAAGRPIGWALASGWGLAALGAIGLWVSITESGSRDIPLALVFLLGPPLAAVLGTRVGSRSRSSS